MPPMLIWEGGALSIAHNGTSKCYIVAPQDGQSQTRHMPRPHTREACGVCVVSVWISQCHHTNCTTQIGQFVLAALQNSDADFARVAMADGILAVHRKEA